MYLIPANSLLSQNCFKGREHPGFTMGYSSYGVQDEYKNQASLPVTTTAVLAMVMNARLDFLPRTFLEVGLVV
jgi:hypothetical protein